MQNQKTQQFSRFFLEDTKLISTKSKEEKTILDDFNLSKEN